MQILYFARHKTFIILFYHFHSSVKSSVQPHKRGKMTFFKNFINIRHHAQL